MAIIYNPIGVFTNAKSKKTEKYCLFEAEFVP